MQKIDKKQIISLSVLLAIALLSIFLFSKIATSPEFHKKTIQTLDKKRFQ